MDIYRGAKLTEVMHDHELKALIPPLSDEEFSQLEANILAEGCRDAVLIWNGCLVDGHNRHKICVRHGLDMPVEYKHFDSKDEAKLWMLYNQLGRRNISPPIRVEIVMQIEHITASKAKERQACGQGGVLLLPNSVKASDPINTQFESAKAAGVGHDYYHKAKTILTKAPEHVKDQFRSGEISANQAYKEIKKEERKVDIERQRDLLAEIGQTKDTDVDFRLGDFYEALEDIPDGSLDCIITDPPYPKEYIDLWSKLSDFAARKLKPGGYCIAYSGQMYLPEVMARMSESLDYYWTFAVYHEGNTQIVNGVNLMCRWKPVLIYQNGKQKLKNTFQDYFISESREKDGHDWQQSISGVSYLIEMFTNVNDLICEPFAGSGTTIKAAIAKGRKIVACEIDERTYNIAKASL